MNQLICQSSAGMGTLIQRYLRWILFDITSISFKQVCFNGPKNRALFERGLEELTIAISSMIMSNKAADRWVQHSSHSFMPWPCKRAGRHVLRCSIFQ